MSNYELLPIMMISKKKVNNIQVNYEDYLIEVLNKSNYFQKLSKNEYFKAIAEQAHGECDAETSNYQIDFKLLIPSEFMWYKNMSLPNIDYSLMKDGVIQVSDNKKSLDKNLQIKANNAFENYLVNVCFSDKKTLIEIKDEESILKSSITNMLKNKNILAFLPCVFEERVNSINIIKKIFSSLFSIRDDFNKDTYLTYIQGDYFHILEYKSGKFSKADKVHKIMIQTFNDLYRLTHFV